MNVVGARTTVPPVRVICCGVLNDNPGVVFFVGLVVGGGGFVWDSDKPVFPP